MLPEIEQTDVKNIVDRLANMSVASLEVEHASQLAPLNAHGIQYNRRREIVTAINAEKSKRMRAEGAQRNATNHANKHAEPAHAPRT